MSATAPAELPPPPIPAAELQGLSDLGCGVCGSTLMLSNRTKNDPIDQLQCLSLTDDANEKSKTVELVEEEADASREQVQKVPQEESSVRKPAGNDTRRIQRIVDLPSEHWQELVECWMCHDEEDIKELREGDLGAREGQVLVGATYLLIHALDIDQDALQVHPDAKKIDLWVLNWDATIMTNQKPDIDSKLTWFGSIGADIEELQQMNGPRKVVKVLYLPAVSDIKNEESTCGSELQGTTSTKRKEEEVWKRWRADHGAEHVRILPTMALGVRLLLEQSSSLLPPNQSKVAMDNMRVGWLLL
ncbi:hypothetical protein BGW42_007829 [Actinomortierella wolfii]|nr:hypothetical protein BGW42_007829 [Actinomortierella wolfii]